MLEVKESLVMAISAIKVNKLRSMLTLLGIVVGVFSIIAVMTAMGVLQNSIESGLSQLGTNTFQVQKRPAGFFMGPAQWAKYRNRKNIKYEQALAVKEQAMFALSVGIELWDFGKVVKSKYDQTNPNVQLAGENPEGISTNNWTVAEGRSINEQDYEYSRNVAIIGKPVADKIFPHSYPVGQQMVVDGVKYDVIGVFEERGGIFGGSQDNFVVVPLTTFMNYKGREGDVHIMVKANSREVYDDAIEQVRGILRTQRKVPPGKEDDFAIFSNESLIKQFNELTFYIKIGVGFISFIALLAAGIGIMNIMLVSVTERTREIGIRKAVGAKKINILTQFIIEAVVLCEVGGFIGVFLGILGGNVAAIVFEFPPIVPYDWAMIGLGVCSLVGIIFGTYPAWKAANLDPIESLRYE